MFLKIMDYNLDFGFIIKIDLYSIVRYHLRVAADSVGIHPGSSSMDSINNLDSIEMAVSDRITQLEPHWDWSLRHTGHYYTS